MFSNRKKLKIQGKTPAHKKSLIVSQVIELVRNGRIKTTPKKAKVLKGSFDRLVTHAKKQTEHSRRVVSSFLNNNERSVEKLYEVTAEKLGDRNSGYTRLIKTLPRKGDNSEQVYVMLVNTEFKEKKSKLKAALEKRDQKASDASIAGRVSNAISKVAKPQRAVVKEKKEVIRRNSK